MNHHLLHLAELKGIAPAFYDIWGREHVASEATLHALLQSMRALGPDEDPQAAIDAHHRARRDEVLPPVWVVIEDEPAWPMPLQWPPASGEPHGWPAADALTWRIDTEAGAVLTGSLREWLAAPRPPLGYHTLSLLACHGEGQDAGHGIGDPAAARCTLIVVPRTAYHPPAVQNGGKAWGAAVQLYTLQSARNWGIGDFTDLAEVVAQWGDAGAGVVGVNPLHALFNHNPTHASPYSPSSRLFLNTLYLDVCAVADFAECDEARTRVASEAFVARLDALRRAELVDYVGVAAAKREVLQILYAHFRREHLARGTERAAQFDAFRARRGLDLRRHALFEALQAHFHASDPMIWGWPVWPEAFRHPGSPAVQAFEADHLAAVEFHEYLQWQADVQLDAVGKRSMHHGLGVGLYVDISVSVDPGGAEAWAQQALYAPGASIGAPPDELSPLGQNWGLPPWDPARLRQAAYAPFVATLRANMRHAGALRIDHVMGLMRLYWIAANATAGAGAYVAYPFDDLLGIVALESRRNSCLVIGEDLGTVHPDVRRKLAATGILSYAVFLFERHWEGAHAGEFKAPQEYARQALAVAATHDMATLAGWWEGCDLALRTQLDLFPSAAVREQHVLARGLDRARLLQVLAREGLLPPGMGVDPTQHPHWNAACMQALHVYLARSPAQLVVAQLEDVLLSREQVNVPGTVHEVPNWRRKLTVALEDWPQDARFTELARRLRDERPRRHG